MSLHHSNMVPGAGPRARGGRYFLVLELVDGWTSSRSSSARRRRLPAAAGAGACTSSPRSAAALAYAHAKRRDGKPLGIVHRDISPQQRADQRAGRGEADRLRHRQGAAQARAHRAPASSRASSPSCRPSRRGRGARRALGHLLGGHDAVPLLTARCRSRRPPISRRCSGAEGEFGHPRRSSPPARRLCRASSS